MLAQTNDSIRKNIVKVIDKSGRFRGTAFFLQKEYCITCHHILEGFDEIYIEKDNIKKLSIYDTGYSDIEKDIAVLWVDDPPVKPLECAKEIFPNLSVLVEGFSSKYVHEAKEVRGHLSRTANEVSFTEVSKDQRKL